MKYREMATKTLIEHPENTKLFRNINDTDPAFWLEFVDSIKKFGIIEPLIVNENTMYVRSGNQRLLAAREIGLEMVPVLLVNPEADSDEEIQRMIASNVFRRTINPFAMFEYIGRLRRIPGNPLSTSYPQAPIRVTAKEVHKKGVFVSAADIFNKLAKEEQEALQEWFNEKAEGQKAKTEGELIAMLRNLENKKKDDEQKYSAALDDIRAIEAELRDAELEKARLLDEVKKMESVVEDYDAQIEELRNVDYEKTIEEKEAEINKLLSEQNKLKSKIKDLKESPDINFYLIDTIKKFHQINAVLKEIVQNTDSLNMATFIELTECAKQTMIILNGVKTQKERMAIE